MVPKPLPTVSMLVELYGEERGDSDPHETNPHPPPYRLRQVSVALAALALGAEEPLSTSLSSQARRLGGRGARATLGCIGGALTRLADAIPSSRARSEQSAVAAGQSGERAAGPAAAAANSSASSSDVRLRTLSMWQEEQAAQREVSPGTEHKTRARTWLGGSFEDAPQDESSDRVSLSLGQAVSSGSSLKDVTKYGV